MRGARDAERLGFESVRVRGHFTGRAPMLAPEVVPAQELASRGLREGLAHRS